MQIIPLSLDSVLLFLHNSKLAYCHWFWYLDIWLGRSNTAGRGRQNSQPSNRGNKHSSGRGRGMSGKTRGSGSRSAATPQVTRPSVQRRGISSNQSNRNAGRGFAPAGQSWGLSSSFSGGTSSLHFQLTPTYSLMICACSMRRSHIFNLNCVLLFFVSGFNQFPSGGHTGG